MKFNPTDDRVIVEPTALETKTSSGFFIPTTAVEEKNRGVIVAVGPGKKNSLGDRIPVTVQVGDTVIYSQGAGTPVKIEGDDFIVIKEEDLIGVFTE